MQRMTMDGISFQIGDDCEIETISEIKTDSGKAKLICVSNCGSMTIQYIRFRANGMAPCVIIGGKDDLSFHSLLHAVATKGALVLRPGEKITRSAFVERVNHLEEEAQHSN